MKRVVCRRRAVGRIRLVYFTLHTSHFTLHTENSPQFILHPSSLILLSHRSLPNHALYLYLRSLCRLVGIGAFGVRCHGQEFLPTDGGAIVLANHQSNLDPMLIGMSTNRRMNYLAKDTLFSPAPFGWLLHALDTIPIDREGVGLAGLKETLKRLRRGELVLVFPEGTRTHDGSVGLLKPGFCALARRSGLPLVPVAVDGAYDAWPRSRLLPLPTRIHVQYGPPFSSAELAAMDDDQMVEAATRRIQDCQEQARRQRKR